jgi:glycosyltransferase involved in cell wall biosynthesis
MTSESPLSTNDSGPGTFGLSVIIPVSDDPGVVECVRALLPCCEGLRVELIVILNGASAEYSEYVRRSFEAESIVRIVEIKERSIPAARNIGVRNALNARVLMFDSDCRPLHSDYLKTVSKELDEASVIVGAVHFRSMDTSAVSQGYAALRQLDYDLHQLARLYTPNVAMRTDVFFKVAPYDERLVTGEDAEFGYRVLAAGWVPRRIPSIEIVHWQQTSFRGAVRTWYLYGRAKGVQLRKKGGGAGTMLRALPYIAAPIGSYLRMAGSVPSTLWLRPLIACAFQTGCLIELILPWRAPR